MKTIIQEITQKSEIKGDDNMVKMITKNLTTGTEQVTYHYSENSSQINSDGRAFNGNKNALLVSLSIILIPVVVFVVTVAASAGSQIIDYFQSFFV